MNWLKTANEHVRTTADSVGKILGMLFGIFFTVAIATGNPLLLGVIHDRMIKLGITSIDTPLGKLDPSKMVLQAATTSRILGISAAHAEELANSAKDEGTKRELVEIAKQLKDQQHVQIETLNNFSAKQRTDSGSRSISDRSETEAWIYLGRRSENSWKPQSFSIGEVAYPVKAGNELVIKSDALLYEDVSCKVIDTSDFKMVSTPRSVAFVSANTVQLQITAEPIECPSIGGAKTVWAKVKVPAARLLGSKQ